MKTPAQQRPLVVAHRGSSGTAPENTMAAFRLAVAAGADMIEFDVRMTRDFELVVHHDRSLGRTSDGSGRIWDLTLGDLRGSDAGSWFAKKFAGERIPTLRQVLEEIMVHTLRDEAQTWWLDADGVYTRQKADPDAFSAHTYFMTNPSLSGRGSALHRTRPAAPRLVAEKAEH